MSNAPLPTAPVPQAHANPVRTRADWERQRAASLADPGVFHGDIAKRQIHWWVRDVGPIGASGAWLSFDDASGRWQGWDAATGAAAAA